MFAQRQIFPALRIAVFAFVALVCFWKLGDAPLLETDEGFAANRAGSMWRHETWRLSYDDVKDVLPQFHKPPMLYWTIAALYPVLGYDVFTVRIPVALASLALCWILFRINRRHFDELTALGSVVLFASIPFVLHHTRTAMLEMPLIFLTFAAVYSLAYLHPPRHPDSVVSPLRRELPTAILAGLAGGAAVLMKGLPGFLAIAVAAIYALLLNKFSAATFRRIAIALLVTAAMFAAYVYLVVPAEWREEMLRALFLREGINRTTAMTLAKRIGSVGTPLWDTAKYLLLLAPLGLALLLIPQKKREPDDDEPPRASPLLWLILLLLICVPVIWVGAKQVVPYPRYFLPAFPFLATLTALAISRIARGHIAALLPITLLAVLGFLAPDARKHHPGPREMPMPGMKEIASLVPRYVMENDHIILASDKIKCHQLLFYGRRPIQFQARWLEEDFKPGAIRYAIAKPGHWINVPYVRVEKLDEAGPFELLRLAIVTSRRDITGIKLCKPEDREKLAATYAARNIPIEPIPAGLLLLKPN